MSIFQVGRVCVKIAGRDAGKKCVVVEEIGGHYVVIDGATRRKKVNVKHLEPLADIADISSGATHDQVGKALSGLNIVILDKKSRQRTIRPMKQRIVKKKTAAGQKTEEKVSAKEVTKKAKGEETP